MMSQLDPQQAELFGKLPPDQQQQLAAQNGPALMQQVEQIKQVLPIAKAKAELAKKELELKHGGRPSPDSPDAAAWRHYEATLEMARRFGV